MAGIISQKVQRAHVFDCNNLQNFIDTITRVLPFGGISMSRLYECVIGRLQFLTKVSFYAKSAPEIYDVTKHKPHPEAEMLILEHLKEKLLSTRATPCIVELVYAHKCDKVSLMARHVCKLDSNDALITNPSDDMINYICEFRNMIAAGIAHDAMSFLILERCDMTIDDFVKKHGTNPIAIAIVESLLFQVVLTLTLIHDVYPEFKHYDLHSDNVMVKFDPNYEFDNSQPSYLIYKRKGKKYYVPYFGIIPKIIDFGHAVLPEENIYSAVVDDKKQMYNRAGLDFLFLLFTLRKTISTITKNLSKYDELFAKLDPSNLYLDYNTTKIRNSNETILQYEEMIPVFKYDVPVSNKFKMYGKFSDKRVLRLNKK